MTTAAQKRAAVLQAAQDLYQTQPAWEDFYRVIFGVSGEIRRTFDGEDDYQEFLLSTEYTEVSELLRSLREGKRAEKTDEPTTVITVRLPKSVHDALRQEAYERKLSINRLCISKLLR